MAKPVVVRTNEFANAEKSVLYGYSRGEGAPDDGLGSFYLDQGRVDHREKTQRQVE